MQISSRRASGSCRETARRSPRARAAPPSPDAAATADSRRDASALYMPPQPWQRDDGGTTRVGAARRPEQESREAHRRAGRGIAIERIERHSLRRRFARGARVRGFACDAIGRHALGSRRAKRSRIRPSVASDERGARRRFATAPESSRSSIAPRAENRRSPATPRAFPRTGACTRATTTAARASHSRRRATSGSARAAVWPLKQTSASAGAARRTRATSPASHRGSRRRGCPAAGTRRSRPRDRCRSRATRRAAGGRAASASGTPVTAATSGQK